MSKPDANFISCCTVSLQKLGRTTKSQDELRTRVLAGYPTEHPSDPDAGRALRIILWPDNPSVRYSEWGLEKPDIRQIFHILAQSCIHVNVENIYNKNS